MEFNVKLIHCLKKFILIAFLKPADEYGFKVIFKIAFSQMVLKTSSILKRSLLIFFFF